MAVRSLLKDRSGAIIPPAPIIVVSEGQITEAVVQQLQAWMHTIVSHMNRVRFGTGSQATQMGNIFGQWIEFVAPSVADVEFQVDHGLGGTPIAYMVGRNDRAGELYDSSTGSWNENRIFFKSSVASKLYRIGLLG